MTRSRIINWWIGRKLDDLHIFFAICGAAVSIVGVFGGYPRLERIGSCGLLVLAAVHLVHLHLHRFQAYLGSHKEYARLPVRQMRQVSGAMMALFLTAFFFLAAAGTFLPLRDFGELLRSGLALFFRWAALFFTSSQEPAPEEGEGGIGDLLADLPAGETSPIALFLEKVFYVAALSLLTLLLFWLLLRGIKRLVRFLGSFHLDEDEKIFLEPEPGEERRTGARKPFFFVRVKPFFDRTHEGRIRRLYWGWVQQGIKRKKDPSLPGRLSQMTPAQIEEELGLSPEGKDLGRIRALYEKARYGNSGCSLKEVEEMRQVIWRMDGKRVEKRHP